MPGWSNANVYDPSWRGAAGYGRREFKCDAARAASTMGMTAGSWFRRGILDFVMFRYAIAACGGVDSLAVTFLDRLPQLPRLVCEKYLGDGADAFPIRGAGGMESGTLSRAKPQYVPFRTDSAEACLEAIASGLEVDVGYCSFGPTRLDKRNLHEPG